MSPERQDQEQRDKGRVPLERPVRLRYRLFQDFLQEVSANLSIGGMFIATDDPHEPESQFEFELTLEDGFSLIKGRAAVVWVRREALDLGRPAGMGVRFVELEGASRTLIAKIVDKLLKKGQRPFDLGEGSPQSIAATGSPGPDVAGSGGARQGPEPAPESPEPVPAELVPAISAAETGVEESEPSTPEAGAAAGSQRVLRLLGLTAASVSGGLAIVVLFHLFYVRPRIEALEQRLNMLSSTEIGLAAPSSAAADVIPTAVVSPVDSVGPLEPRAIVDQWARAWSEKRVEDYLGFYVSGFEPDGEMSREEWEALRRARIRRHGEIDVRVLLVEETVVSPEERLVSFVQSYRSPTYQDRVQKVLRMVLEDGEWKIAEERVVRARPD